MISGEKIYDIAIVGAGPAGTALARALLAAGVKPLIIDKAVFPRTKLCAGGLPARVLNLLPPDVGGVLTNKISRVSLSYNLGRGFTRGYSKALIYTTARVRLDNFLVDQVVVAGAEFSDGERFLGLIPGPDFLTVQTSKRNFGARVVAGADGVRSRVAAAAGLEPVNFWHQGLQVELPTDWLNDRELARGDGIRVDWGTIPDGYGWVFPQGEQVVAGVGGPLQQGARLQQYQTRLLASLGLAGRKLPLEAHLIPHRVRPTRITTERVLLLGDAAGLADYWTGEGIWYAVKSGGLAAGAILRFLEGDRQALQEYQYRVDREITPELKTSYQFSKIFNYLGPLASRCLREYDYPWDVFCRIMRGDRSFTEIKNRFRPDILAKKLLLKSSRHRDAA